MRAHLTLGRAALLGLLPLLACKDSSSTGDCLPKSAPAAAITADQVSQWNNAYGWGNHATAGYLSTEADPVHGASACATIRPEDVARWNSAFHEVGEEYGGGIVFYVYDGGLHGLVAARADLPPSVWATSFTATGITGDGLLAGRRNTAQLVAVQGGPSGTAADRSDRYTQDGAPADWYLPSAWELARLYAQREAVGGFTSEMYWSSTEVTEIRAAGVWFESGESFQAHKGMDFAVRPIRAF